MPFISRRFGSSPGQPSKTSSSSPSTMFGFLVVLAVISALEPRSWRFLSLSDIITKAEWVAAARQSLSSKKIST